MITIVKLIFIFLAVYTLFVVLYLVILTVAALIHPQKSPPNVPLRVPIAVVIPAHNEESILRNTLSSIFANDYPRELLEVYVIADNCTDNTAEIGEEMGAKSFIRIDASNRGKGQALQWFLRTEEARLKNFSIIIFLDADVTVAPTFFSTLVNAFSSSEVNVAQSFNGVSNIHDNWRVALTYAGFAGVNHLRPLGQDRLFGGTVLKGTGMAFRSEVLLSQGWQAYSIVEDLEMTIQLALQAIPVRYVPEAKMTSVAESKSARAASQRRRWEGGRIALSFRMAPKIFCNLVKHPRLLLVGLLGEIITPPLSLLTVLITVIGCFAIISSNTYMFLLSVVLLLGEALYVFAALKLVQAPRTVYLALLKAPAFIVWKLILYFGLIMKPEGSWTKTHRSVEKPLGRDSD